MELTVVDGNRGSASDIEMIKKNLQYGNFFLIYLHLFDF